MESKEKFATQLAEPDAKSMIETFRAYGYSIETAVADIIDNSISANAKNILLDYEWRGKNTMIFIKDDGHGMDEKEIIQAMRPGSKNPIDKREKKDLGRFGLGLKTSSFSQTRKFTLISKCKSGNVNFWSWDLDHVNDSESWELIKFTPSKESVELLEKSECGTTVIWYDIDRLFKGNESPDDKKSLSRFMEIMEIVKNHLAMVFHRYIEQNKLEIRFQGRPIDPWDPYLRGVSGIQAMPDEILPGGKVKMKGYILPHKSKISSEIFKDAAGRFGWNAHQGFYIYRNERLLVAGDWLNLYKKEEHYKLARIMIDLPNDIDDLWQIDIKKSVARPPMYIRENIKAYADDVRAKAVEVYRYKGKSLQRKYPSMNYMPVWMEKQRHSKRYYTINRDHPLVKEILVKYGDMDISTFLKFIEETVPIPLITIKESEEPESHGIPFEGANHDILKKKLSEMFESLISNGKNIDEAAAILLSIEPFDKYPQYIESLRNNI